MPPAQDVIRTMKWFDRKFAFDSELWMYPNIVERLRGMPARLEERMHGIDPAVRTRRLGDDWSAQEHAGHLWDLESLWHKRVQDFHAGLPELEPADLKNRKTHEAMHNDNPLETILDAFSLGAIAFGE